MTYPKHWKKLLRAPYFYSVIMRVEMATQHLKITDRERLEDMKRVEFENIVKGDIRSYREEVVKKKTGTGQKSLME